MFALRSATARYSSGQRRNSLWRLVCVRFLWLLVILPQAAFSDIGDEIAPLLGDDTDLNDGFGFSVAIDGDRCVVGAWSADPGAFANAGSAYVFDSLTGEQLLSLTPSTTSVADFFGYSVALDGNLIAVGAIGANGTIADTGAVFIFDATTGAQIRKISPGDGKAGDNFGISVSLSGSTVAIGSISANGATSFSGAVYIYNALTGQLLHKLQARDGLSGDEFGRKVDMTSTRVVIAASGDDDQGNSSGSAYVFDLESGQQLWKLKALDGAANRYFGASVAVNGSTAVIGANGSSSGPGIAYVFNIDTGGQVWKLTPSDGVGGDQFGISAAIRKDVILIGSPGHDNSVGVPGACYFFNAVSGLQTYTYETKTFGGAIGAGLGFSVDLSESTAIAGAWSDTVNGVVSGSARLFESPPSGSQIITPSQTYGSVSTSWFQTSNWSTDFLPTEIDSVVIDFGSGAEQLVIDQLGAVAGDLHLVNGDLSLIFLNKDLTLTGFNEPDSPSLGIANLFGSDATLSLLNIGNSDHGIFAESIGIGLAAMSNGTMIVDGETTRVRANDDAVFGDEGAASIIVKNSARFETLQLSPNPDHRVVLGESAGGSGTVDVFNVGSSWQIATGQFIIGDAGLGSLNLTNGGQVFVEECDEWTLGAQAGGFGSLLVSGAGSGLFLYDSSVVTFGGGGDSVVSVQNGGQIAIGQLDAPTDLVIGGTDGGTSTIDLSGTDSVMTVEADSLMIGVGGDAQLTVDEGATLFTRTAIAGPAVVGGDGGSADILIRGGWLESTPQKTIVFGDGGAAHVTIDNGQLDILSFQNEDFVRGTIRLETQAELGGRGLINANVINRGAVRLDVEPEGAVGEAQSLTVGGDYSQRKAGAQGDASGTLHARILPDGTSDTLFVAGNVDLGGTLLIDGSPTLFDSYVIYFNDAITSNTFDAAFLVGSPDYSMSVSKDTFEGVAGGGGVLLDFELSESALALDDPASFDTPAVPVAIALGDLTGGPPDLAIAAPPGSGVAGSGLVLIYTDLEVADGQLIPSNSELPIILDGGANPQAVAIGDITGDGIGDVVVADAVADGAVLVYEGDGQGGFESWEGTDLSFDTPMAVALADLNGDEAVDMVVCAAGADAVSILLAVDPLSGIFDTQVVGLTAGSVPCSVEPVDIDGDSDFDLIVGTFGSSKVIVLENDGGTFGLTLERSVDLGPMAVVGRNLNGPADEGFPEVITANATGGSLSVLRNSTTTPGDVALEPASSVPVGMVLGAGSLAAIDYDLDDDLDLAVVAMVGGVPHVQLIRNESTADQVVLVVAETLDGGDGEPILVLDGLVDGDENSDLITVSGAGGGGVAGSGSSVSARLNGPATVPGDLNGDKAVNGADLGLLLASWGPCQGCDADLNGDGTVDGADLGLLLSAWTN